MTYEDVYKDIKELEGIFDIPTPSLTIQMGTFDVSTGTFRGKTTSTTYESLSDLFPTRPGQPVRIPPPRYTHGLKVVMSIKGNRVEIKTIHAPKVDAVNVLLEFNVRNAAADGFTVIANGITQTSSSGEGKVTVNVKNARRVEWKVHSGSKWYEDVIEIRRFPIIAGGAFTIPVLPVAIVYEPPSDSERRNYATYYETKGICTATEMTFSTESSETRPEAPDRPGFPSAEEFQGIMKGTDSLGDLYLGAIEDMSPEDIKKRFGEDFDLPKALSKMGDIFSAFKAIGEGIEWAFGTASAHVTQGRSEEHSEKIITCTESGSGIETGENDGGPGVGDLIYYWRDVKLAWLAPDGPVQLVLLGYEEEGYATAGGIKRALMENDLAWLAKSGLDTDTARALLSIDPFVNNPTGVPPSERFEEYGPEKSMNCHGLDWSMSFNFDWKDSKISRTAKASFRTKIQEYHKGFLSFLGVGVAEDETIRASVRHTSASEVTETYNVSATAKLYCGHGDLEPYSIQVYLDHVFRTFAFREIPLRDKPIVSGTALSMTGKPLVHHFVTLKSHGKEYMTVTNNQGGFAFYSPNIKRGSASLVAGDASMEFLLTPERPALNLIIKKCGVEGGAPKVHSRGRIDIPQTWTLDLDEGKLNAGTEADIWFAAETAVRRYVIPCNGAKIAKVGMSSVGWDGCAAAHLSTSKIPISSLPHGSHVCVLTNRGRYSQFCVNAPVGPSPGVLKIEYTTWE